jgi:hypothetical protein
VSRLVEKKKIFTYLFMQHAKCTILSPVNQQDQHIREEDSSLLYQVMIKMGMLGRGGIGSCLVDWQVVCQTDSGVQDPSRIQRLGPDYLRPTHGAGVQAFFANTFACDGCQ